MEACACLVFTNTTSMALPYDCVNLNFRISDILSEHYRQKYKPILNNIDLNISSNCRKYYWKLKKNCEWHKQKILMEIFNLWIKRFYDIAPFSWNISCIFSNARGILML